MNSASPAALIALKNGPMTGSLIRPSRSGWPSRSRMPAAGSTAIGSMRLLPSRCSCANAGIRRPDFTCAPSDFVVSLIALSPSWPPSATRREAERKLRREPVNSRPSSGARSYCLWHEPPRRKGAPTVSRTRVLAPVAGRAVALQDVPDPVFSAGMVGYGAAVDPPRGVIEAIAPVSGKLLKLMPHAYVDHDRRQRRRPGPPGAGHRRTERRRLHHTCESG